MPPCTGTTSEMQGGLELPALRNLGTASVQGAAQELQAAPAVNQNLTTLIISRVRKFISGHLNQ